MTRNQLNTIAIVLAVASVALSILLKGIFLVLLIPAFFFWGKARPKDDR